jgi:hypothetical protein
MKKKIEIEFEAENEDTIKRRIDLLKSDLVKNNRCPIIKYKLKERINEYSGSD